MIEFDWVAKFQKSDVMIDRSSVTVVNYLAAYFDDLFSSLASLACIIVSGNNS